MSENFDRRRLMQLSLAALPTLMALRSANGAVTDAVTKPVAGVTDPKHDFDFFLGTWHVRHRRLKVRLAGNNEWMEYDGTTDCRPLLGGIANYNDSVVNRPGGPFRGVGIRAFDAKAGHWADWYLDGQYPTVIDTPAIGRFKNGVGTFYSDDTFESKPIKVRGMFSPVSPGVAQWEQAFSTDGGKSWETNLILRYTRTA